MIFLPEKIKDSEFCATINKMVEVGEKTVKKHPFLLFFWYQRREQQINSEDRKTYLIVAYINLKYYYQESKEGNKPQYTSFRCTARFFMCYPEQKESDNKAWNKDKWKADSIECTRLSYRLLRNHFMKYEVPRFILSTSIY